MLGQTLEVTIQKNHAAAIDQHTESSRRHLLIGASGCARSWSRGQDKALLGPRSDLGPGVELSASQIMPPTSSAASSAGWSARCM